VEPKSSGTSACRSLQRHLTSVQRYSPTSPLGNAALTRPLLAATTPRDRCSPCDDGHHRRAQTAHNGNPIVPDIGQSGLRLLFTCIPITVISVVLSGDPMGATATTPSYAGRNLRGTDGRLVLNGSCSPQSHSNSSYRERALGQTCGVAHLEPVYANLRPPPYSVRLTVTPRSRMLRKRWLLLPCVLRMGYKAL
jgi:hypothetical protein